MFPYNFIPYSRYNAPSYSPGDADYLQALADEQQARQAYAEAVRAQADARARAARARRARQAFERAHSAYLSDEDEDVNGGNGNGYASFSPRERPLVFVSPERALLEEQQRRELEQQRRREAIELERARERERIRQLEEEQRRRLLEEDRRRRMLLEEELRKQKENEEREQEEMRRRLHDEYLRRQSLSPLEQLLGIRPSRSMQPEPNHTHRARTMSPPSTRREPSFQPTQRTPPPAAQQERTSSFNQRPHSASPVHKVPTSPRAPTPPRAAPPPRPAATPEQIAAVKKIQELWRSYEQRRKAMATITRISTTFESSKSAFALPSSLDYQQIGQDISHHITVPTTGVELNGAMPLDMETLTPVPKLAYTPTNAPVHVYEEELNRMLTQLDEVQSGGDQEVRNRRRELARKIEREAQRLEWIKVSVWKAWEEQRKATEARESTAAESAVASAVVPEHSEMEVDQSAPAEPSPSVPVVVVVPPAPEAEMDVEPEAPTESEAETEKVERMLTEEPETHPREVTSPPPLVDTHSEAGDSEATLRTPVLEHAHLEAPPAVASEPKDVSMQEAQESAKRRQQATADLLSSLYPLYSQDWDDVDDWDLF